MEKGTGREEEEGQCSRRGGRAVGGGGVDCGEVYVGGAKGEQRGAGSLEMRAEERREGRGGEGKEQECEELESEYGRQKKIMKQDGKG